jgi:hypothetical protein
MNSPIVLLALTLLGGLITAQAPQPGPPMPYEDHGACPFECCSYRTWVVERDTRILAERTDGAGTVFVARRGQQVEGLTGVVVTTKLGRAVVRRPTTIGLRALEVKPGDQIRILNYMGEGVWKLWIQGVVDEDEIPTPKDPCYDGRTRIPCAIVMTDEPVYVWWAKVRSAAGLEGWTRQLDRFGNIDACG